MPNSPFISTQVTSDARAPDKAVAELRERLSNAVDVRGVLFFCDSKYDLSQLGAAMKTAFQVPVVGCTAAGHFWKNGMKEQGIVATAMSGAGTQVTPFLISPLSEYKTQIAQIATQTFAQREKRPGSKAFGLLLIDGLSRFEEQVTAEIYGALGDISLVGGSAGDDQKFVKTAVYHDGRFVSDAALFVLVETYAPFKTFKFQNFEPTSRRLVVTEADPSLRLISELNGMPAAEAYASLVGVDPKDLSMKVFARNPLMVRVDDDYFVRSLSSVTAEGGLQTLCSIEKGTVLTLGTPTDAVAHLEESFRSLEFDGEPAKLIVGCDCVLRRLSYDADGDRERVNALVSKYGMFGFSTYGEQWNNVHVNQTLTGVAIGGRK